MQSIHMTDAEAETYEGDDEALARDIIFGLMERADQLARETGQRVEIYCADYVVAASEPVEDWA